MDFRDRTERHRVFWQDLGCVLQLFLGIICLIVGSVAVVAILRNGTIESTVMCRQDAHVELRLNQHGMDWSKELVVVSIYDKGRNPIFLLLAHQENTAQFDDIQSILFCTPHGIAIRGMLRGSKTSAVFEVSFEKKVSLYGSFVP